MLGEEDWWTQWSMNNLARLYRDRGRYDEAEELYVKGLEIARRAMGEEDWSTVNSMYQLGVVYIQQGRYDEAEPLLIKSLEISGRLWGPEQATGAPDTHEAGDSSTAWSSLTADEQDEWLLLEYTEPVVAIGIKIYETCNPGAVHKVGVFTPDGREVEVWSGKDPTAPGSGMGVSEILFKIGFKTKRVKIYLDSPSIPGWNEVDAVGLIDESGRTQWAMQATASSRFAEDTQESIKSLVELYEAWGKPEKAEEWRAKLPSK
jgi:tetratricopeptide (TPR) repeat protein